MKKTIIVLTSLLLFSIDTFAQKIQKEFWGVSKQVSFEYQTDNAGVKNGYYKSFTKTGLLVQSGTYKAGKQNGVWTEFDEKGSGQTIATFTYLDDKLNGPSKQWKITGGKRWLWHDDVFKNGDKVSGVTYYSNGKKEEELKDGFTLTWTEDGTANEQIINGKLFTYYVTGVGERVLQKIQFDTLGYKATYYYGGSNDLGSISFDDKNVKFKNVESYNYNNSTKPEVRLDGNPNGKPIALDSVVVRKAILLYMTDPNPKKSKGIVYDQSTGDILDNRGNVGNKYHYLGKPENSVFRTISDAKGLTTENYFYKYDGDGREIEFGIHHYYENGKLTGQIEFIPSEPGSRFSFSQKIKKTYYENGKLRDLYILDAYGSQIKSEEYDENGNLRK